MILGLDLMNEIVDRLGWKQISTLEGAGELEPEQRKILKLTNRVLKSLDAGADWPLLREEGDLLLIPGEEDNDFFMLANGDETWQQSVTNRTGDLNWDQSYKNRAVQIGAENTVYRITQINSNIQVELSRPWLGDTTTGGLSGEELLYKIVQDQYTLPEDFGRPLGSWKNFFAPYGIDYVSPSEMSRRRRARGNSILISDPQVFTMWGLSPDGVHRLIHFDPYPENQRLLSFEYQKIHPDVVNDNDRILYPHTYHSMIIEAVLHLANRDYENSDKMDVVLRDFVREFNNQRGQPELTEAAPRLTPDSRHRQMQYRKWQYGTRKIDWGDEFDRSDRVGFK
ncbi:MAG: hypothetical protein AMJ55_00415 [Gammaproteobacteria bacterium SG8_15]|nr:MAG: hypothetical protein AMJ55_00415 [Gammaproteobacteria bacterium SG8_15]